MVGCACVLFTSHDLRAKEASDTLPRVFLHTGRPYMCVSCAFPYLKPGGDSEFWQRAVRCGIIKYAELIENLKTMGVRTYAMREGENVKGTVLRWCFPCYAACRPPARKGFVAQCHSLLHPLVKTDAATSSLSGPVCIPSL